MCLQLIENWKLKQENCNRKLLRLKNLKNAIEVELEVDRVRAAVRRIAIPGQVGQQVSLRRTGLIQRSVGHVMSVSIAIPGQVGQQVSLRRTGLIQRSVGHVISAHISCPSWQKQRRQPSHQDCPSSTPRPPSVTHGRPVSVDTRWPRDPDHELLTCRAELVGPDVSTSLSVTSSFTNTRTHQCLTFLVRGLFAPRYFRTQEWKFLLGTFGSGSKNTRERKVLLPIFPR